MAYNLTNLTNMTGLYDLAVEINLLSEGYLGTSVIIVFFLVTLGSAILTGRALTSNLIIASTASLILGTFLVFSNLLNPAVLGILAAILVVSLIALIAAG